MQYQSKPYHLLVVALMLLLVLPVVAQTQQHSPEVEAHDHLTKGNLYLNHKQYAQALEEYEKVLQLDSHNQAAHNNLVLTHNNWGIYYYSQKKYDEALQEWQTALKLDPTHKSAKHNIAVLEQVLGRQNKPTPSVPAEKSTEPAEATQPSAKTDKAEPTPEESRPEEPAAKLLTPITKQSQPQASSTSEEVVHPAASKPSTNTYSAQEEEGSPFNTPPTHSSRPAATPTTSAAPESLENELEQVEVKIYGSKQSNMTVMQRLEKLENDSTGQVHTGTIKSRIEQLRHSYGL